jgi:transmembrane sensor
MRISDHLIESVLSGGGTDEEKRLVMEYLKENPDKLAQYLTDESWERFEGDKRGEVPREKMLQTIEDKVGPAPVNRGSVRRMRYGWVAAASVVLIAGLVALLYRKGDRVEKNARPAISVAHASERQTITNSSLKPQVYSLPDGSKVKLAGNSSVTYYNPFVNNRRDFYLTGEGIFTVAKDAARPFAVHSKGIMTTALGTVFGVNDRGGLYTTVHLYSGRIVVNKEAKDGKAFAAVYLLPGEQLLLNNVDLSVKVTRNKPKPAAAAIAVVKPQLHVLPFTKKPLTEIFDLLQKQYAVTITYDRAGLKNMDFTGVFDSDKETLESFLSTLCDLNELTFKKTGDKSFSIHTK